MIKNTLFVTIIYFKRKSGLKEILSFTFTRNQQQQMFYKIPTKVRNKMENFRTCKNVILDINSNLPHVYNILYMPHWLWWVRD